MDGRLGPYSNPFLASPRSAIAKPLADFLSIVPKRMGVLRFHAFEEDEGHKSRGQAGRRADEGTKLDINQRLQSRPNASRPCQTLLSRRKLVSETIRLSSQSCCVVLHILQRSTCLSARNLSSARSLRAIISSSKAARNPYLLTSSASLSLSLSPSLSPSVSVSALPSCPARHLPPAISTYLNSRLVSPISKQRPVTSPISITSPTKVITIITPALRRIIHPIPSHIPSHRFVARPLVSRRLTLVVLVPTDWTSILYSYITAQSSNLTIISTLPWKSYLGGCKVGCSCQNPAEIQYRDSCSCIVVDLISTSQAHTTNNKKQTRPSPSQNLLFRFMLRQGPQELELQLRIPEGSPCPGS